MSRHCFGANYGIGFTTRFTCRSLHQETRWRGRNAGRKNRRGLAVFVSAGGIPRGGATAADCTLITVGEIKGNAFQGEIKYQLDTADEKPGPDNAAEAGHKMTIAFAPQSATVTAADVGSLCGNATGILGRYTKERK